MKKNVTKLNLKTDKIVSLSVSKMNEIVGGNKKQIASGPIQSCDACSAYC